MKKRRLSVSQQIFSVANERLALKENNVSRRNYTYIVKRFIKYCRENFNSRTFDDCKTHIQEYINSLLDDKTPSTIHTYCAALTYIWGLKMHEIEKPRRVASGFTRNRSPLLNMRSSQDLDNPKHNRIVSFQKCVGIRRNELRKLTGDCFLETENGSFVLVKSGKGGKRQLQKIMTEHENFVKGYFLGIGANERVFSKEELSNELPFHKLRADCARECYFKLLKKVQENPEFASQLEREVREAWKRDKGDKPFPESQIRGYYYLRGGNRRLAREKGLPIVYNRLVLMWVSCYKLAHHRTNVCVNNYILA